MINFLFSNVDVEDLRYGGCCCCRDSVESSEDNIVPWDDVDVNDGLVQEMTVQSWRMVPTRNNRGRA
jgi:hypothetical protein